MCISMGMAMVRGGGAGGNGRGASGGLRRERHNSGQRTARRKVWVGGVGGEVHGRGVKGSGTEPIVLREEGGISSLQLLRGAVYSKQAWHALLGHMSLQDTAGMPSHLLAAHLSGWAKGVRSRLFGPAGRHESDRQPGHAEASTVPNRQKCM